MDWISDIRSLIMTGYLKFIITLKRKFYWPSGGTHHHWQPHTNRDLYITTRRMYCRVFMGGQKQITGFSFIDVLGFCAASWLLGFLCCGNSGGLRLTRSSYSVLHLVCEQSCLVRGLVRFIKSRMEALDNIDLPFNVALAWRRSSPCLVAPHRTCNGWAKGNLYFTCGSPLWCCVRLGAG